ncbi:phosphatase PAP2 family protein [Rosenbergiella epipactidis]|uniref:phosphatase PAP2 family protein n=1 Tax=Rosenbergiella epipactidis TaxID=1544694 RepID=UPI001BDA8B5D|nr:phosphatase PAP2 family protein [Rosenbergiella epipactidis]MBT0717049.1 phosphatase PAP2 family protein [Rosenbergiella epipactidis]
MAKQLQNLTIGALLLLLPALLTLLYRWHWTGQFRTLSAYPFYLFTQTVTRPWGIITSIILAYLLYRHVQSSVRKLWVVLLLIVVVVWGGQGIKSLLKPYFAEPRPYVVALMEQMHQSPDFFYHHTKLARQQLVSQAQVFWPSLPDWQQRHWQHETGYSFPSGHSFFVASWLLLFYGLLSFRKSWPVLILVTLWAWAVMWSRMLLGMHWPRDLVASVVIAWGFTLVVLVVYNVLSRRRSV